MTAYRPESLLAELRKVDVERALRAADAALAARVLALKEFQQRRFASTYADLLCNERYAPAARFFLEELYGPGDYTRRDAQFARVVPALTRLFPHEVVETVARLAELHALSEQLDTQMATVATAQDWDATRYCAAWRAVGQPQSRARQISLTLDVGHALDDLTRKPLLRQTLRMMRGPAALAGLSELQAFLESGFDTFKAMGGATLFLATVREREQGLAAILFEGDGPAVTEAIGQFR